MKAKVNYNAVGSWLEPYIGHEFQIYSVTNSIVIFWMNYENGEVSRMSEDRKLFDIISI